MSSNSISENEGNEENKVIRELIDFFHDFETSNNTVFGHVVWKKRIKTTKVSGEGLDPESVEKPNFRSTEYAFESDLGITVAKAIEEKLSKIHYDELKFQLNKRLPNESYGVEEGWNYEILREYLGSLTSSSTSDDKKDLVFKDKDGHKRIEDGTSIALRFVKFSENKRKEAVFIKLLNIKHALARSKQRVILDLKKEIRARSIGEYIIIEPDNFDCAVFEDKLFMFHSSYFYYLFVPTQFLSKEIEKKKIEMEKTIQNPEYLISFAKLPAHTRDLYYFSQNSKIPSKKEILLDLKLMEPANNKEKLFELSADNKIICTKENAGLVLSYVCKKLGLRISDKRLLNVESSTEF